MKKQIHILQGLMILLSILIISLCSIKFIYAISHEKIDTTYMWNIEFNNIVINPLSSKGDIKLDNNKLLLDVTLNNENDFYEFTMDIFNRGSLDAKITDINISSSNDNIFKYQLNYLDGNSLLKGDILKSLSKTTIKVRIWYPKLDKKIYESLHLDLSLNIKYEAIY